LESLAEALLTGAAAFAATNLDDLVLLTAFFGDRMYRPGSVIAGQYAGIALLYGVSLAAFVIPQAYAALLGVLPIAIGLKKLFETRAAAAQLPHSGSMLSVATVTVANGGDNIAVYVPLFAAYPKNEVWLIGAVFAAMTALWCYAAWRLVAHPGLGQAIRAHGHRVLPWVLIALGVWILLGF
jgi:cadmium resistance protein CadD (predicted permease)